jgi:YHS domain-containing protein
MGLRLGDVDVMNAARGQAKVDAMAAVISEMINQRKQMREQMASMTGQSGMMGQGGMMGDQGQQGMMTGTSGGAMSGMASTTFDPVCRARIADKTAPAATYQGKTYRFCSEADKRAFLKNPAKYAKMPE